MKLSRKYYISIISILCLLMYIVRSTPLMWIITFYGVACVMFGITAQAEPYNPQENPKLEKVKGQWD